MKKSFLMVGVISLLLIVLFTACAPTQTAKPASEVKTLKLGCLMPFTGGASQWGLLMRPEMEVYAELINEDGGIKVGNDTYKVELHFIDDGYMPAPGAAGARELIYDEGVVAIVGYFSSGSAAVAGVTNPEKVIFIGRTGAGVNYDAERDKYMIFGTPSSEVCTYQVVAAMKAYPDIKVIGWTAPEAARKAAESAFDMMDKAIEQRYGVKSYRAYYPEGTTNFTPYIMKMAENGVQLVSSGGSQLEVALTAKQRWAAGYKWPIVETGTMVDPAMFIGISGYDGAQGVVSDRTVPWELKEVTVAPGYLDMAKRIKVRFEEKFGKPMVYQGCYGWGAHHMALYFEAIKRVGTLDPDKVMEAFRGGTFETFLGKYTLGGTKLYGAPVICGHPGSVGIIKGKEEVYLGEHALLDADLVDQP
ncbi:MAG: ABC transporter substrate-binding protein [Chloroflexi bacterium]|nr:ABC transporter substrate-binding protein [Chloroflexota bacterium]